MSKLDYGYNIPALKGMMLEEIQTPCLLIDYETFKLNVEKMRSFTHENNIKLRPHAKMHKSVEVAKYQLKYGNACLLYTSPSPRDTLLSRMPSSA